MVASAWCCGATAIITAPLAAPVHPKAHYEKITAATATKDGLKKQYGEYGIIYSGSGYNFLEFQILILPTHVI